MIDQDLSIEPPPSLEAILAHRERIGRVDFTHRLVVAPEPPPAAEQDEPVDQHEPADQELGDAAPHEADPATDPVAVVVPALPAGSTVPETAGPDQRPGDQPAEADPAPQDAAADVRPRAVEPADADHEDPDDFLLAPPVDDSPAAHARAEASAQVAALLSLVPAEDVDTVTEDVSEVVEGVLARIREVQSATLAHLEAIEVEAALRCEMLTAQAELDAELIRLHARREAHAILAAARARAGMPPAVPDDLRRLDHLAGAASRLVESLEETRMPGSPDHPFLP